MVEKTPRDTLLTAGDYFKNQKKSYPDILQTYFLKLFIMVQALPPLVIIWIGSHFPAWGHTSLKLAKLLSGLPVILVSSKEIGIVSDVDSQYFIEDFYIAPSSWNNSLRADINFREGFWIKTTERFFILNQFAVNYSFPKLFHAELDNLIFDISGLAPELDALGQGVFCPRDSKNRGIASLIYINKHDSLKALTDLALDITSADMNDMDLLGHLLNTSDQFFSLPTERSFQTADQSEWSSINPKTVNGIFDAAAIGQFLFGIDHRNATTFLFNGFENENAGCDLWDLNYDLSFEKRTCLITNRRINQRFNLFNIHVHSKLFAQINNENRRHKILERMNAGQKTLLNIDLMQNRLMRGIKSRIRF